MYILTNHYLTFHSKNEVEIDDEDCQYSVIEMYGDDVSILQDAAIDLAYDTTVFELGDVFPVKVCIRMLNKVIYSQDYWGEYDVDYELLESSCVVISDDVEEDFKFD